MSSFAKITLVCDGTEFNDPNYNPCPSFIEVTANFTAYGTIDWESIVLPSGWNINKYECALPNCETPHVEILCPECTSIPT